MPKDDLILLALGDEQIQNLFERTLAAAGYQAAIAKDRGSFEQVFQEAIPSLVIIHQDFDPDNSMVFAGSLLERFPTLPIIYLVTRDSPELVRKAIHIGISDCLFTPIKTDEIILTIKNSIQRASRLGDWNRREIRRNTASLQERLVELQKFDTILNHIDDGVIILDEKMNILLVNLAARRVFGIWKEETLAGKKVLEVLNHPELCALVTGETNRLLPHHEISFGDGRALSAQYTQIPGVGAAITLQDISYLKQIDRLKNEFVSTVSHDLRSPLTAILGYVDLLERVGSINEQQREFIKRVQLSVQSITMLVNDLLELGRIEAGLDIQKELVPLEGIIRYTIENVSNQINEKHLEVCINLPDTLPPLLGNPIRLRQLLDNLVGNAIKYTPEGGKITISAEVQSRQAILRVEDTGPGIPPADQPHIFEKFYRGSNIAKGIGGSGLGLAIVKSIVENHQGRIWVESVLGQGSVFTVVLPLAGEAEMVRTRI